MFNNEEFPINIRTHVFKIADYAPHAPHIHI